jgi:hypothetical protein
MNIDRFEKGDTVIITGYGQSIQIASFLDVDGIVLKPPSITGKVREIGEDNSVSIEHPVLSGGFVKFSPVEQYNCYKAENSKTGKDSCLKMFYPFFLELKKSSLPVVE